MRLTRASGTARIDKALNAILLRQLRDQAGLLVETEAADYLGVPYEWLRNLRVACDRRCPKHEWKGRVLRYRVRDLDAWIERRVSKPWAKATQPKEKEFSQ